MMLWSTISTVVLVLVTSTTAKPVAKRGGNFDRVEELTRLYPAIIWETAAGQCTTEDFNILAETVRVVNDDMLQPGTRNFGDDLIHTSAFNKFFIRPDSVQIPFEGNWASNHNLTATFYLIKDVFRALAGFMTPIEDGTPKRSRRIRYLCQPWPNSSPCAAGVGASTYPLLMDPDPGPSTVFCPMFFNKASDRKGLEYIQDIAKQKQWKPSDLPQVRSREHGLIHEMCHVNAATGRTTFSHITDVITTLPGDDVAVDIYGATRSHDLAWKEALGPFSSRTVNEETHMNADNFAWVYTNRWMAERFGWQDDGSEPLAILAEEDLVVFKDGTEEAFQGFPDFSTLTMPPNCFYKSEDENFDDVLCVGTQGMTQDEWAAARNEPYESSGGCELSSQCKVPHFPTLEPDSACECKCDGQSTSLLDERCKGFEGSLPSRDNPVNGKT